MAGSSQSAIPADGKLYREESESVLGPADEAEVFDDEALDLHGGEQHVGFGYGKLERADELVTREGGCDELQDTSFGRREIGAFAWRERHSFGKAKCAENVGWLGRRGSAEREELVRAFLTLPTSAE